MTELKTPFDKNILKNLKIGDAVSISGVIYTARDAAHERMVKEFNEGKGFPFEIEGQTVYYAGPCPAKPGEIIGSCGPTTAGRMDSFTPLLLDNGLAAMIGKGARNNEVREAVIRNKAVYFGVTGGAGALISECIKNVEVICYDDLGTEAIRKLLVENLPAVVLMDSTGEDLYKKGREEFKA